MTTFRSWLENQETKLLILMRGLSGSGKSTLARQIAGPSGVVFSTDDFFMKDGVYQFDLDKLTANHQANIARTEEAMKAGRSPIVIDNTNVSAYEAKPYVRLAQQYGYRVDVQQPQTPWRFDAAELARRNTHGVPQEAIQKMIDRWDDDFSTDAIMKSKAPWENE